MILNYDQYPTSVEQYAKRVFGDPKQTKHKNNTKQNQKTNRKKKINKMKKKLKKKAKKKEEKNRYSIF